MATYIQTFLSKVETLILQKTAMFSLGEKLCCCLCLFSPLFNLQVYLPILEFTFFIVTGVLHSFVVYIRFFIPCSLLRCFFTNFARCSKQWYIHVIICSWSENITANMYLKPEFWITQTGPVGNRPLPANFTLIPQHYKIHLFSHPQFPNPNMKSSNGVGTEVFEIFWKEIISELISQLQCFFLQK